MANGLISCANLIDGAALTASSEAGDLGVANLADKASRRVWRATSGTAWCQADFGSDMSIGVVGLVFPRSGLLPAASDTIRLQLDADGGAPGTGAAYDGGAVASGIAPSYGVWAHVFPAPVSARYLRATIATANGYVQAGRLWAGAYLQPGRNYGYGWSEQWGDLTTVNQPPKSGMRFRNPGAISRQVSANWGFLSPADADGIKDGLAGIGVQGQVLVCLDPDAPMRSTVIGGLSAAPSFAQPSFDSHAVSLTIQED